MLKKKKKHFKKADKGKHFMEDTLSKSKNKRSLRIEHRLWLVTEHNGLLRKPKSRH